MKHRWAQRAGALAVLGLSTGVLAPACVDNESTMVVQFVTTDFTSCVEGADFISLGTMDISVTQSYFNSIQIANQLITHADEVRRRTETDIIVLREAEVTVEGPGGTLSEFTWPLAGIIDAGGPGKSRPTTNIGVLMVDPVAASQMSDGDIVTTNIKVFGRTEGGFELESPVFTFPIQVCQGCLVNCLDGDDPEIAGPCDAEPEVPEDGFRPGEDCAYACNLFYQGPALCGG